MELKKFYWDWSKGFWGDGLELNSSHSGLHSLMTDAPLSQYFNWLGQV